MINNTDKPIRVQDAWHYSFLPPEPQLNTIEDVICYLHQAANSYKKISELRKAIRIARDALGKLN